MLGHWLLRMRGAVSKETYYSVKRDLLQCQKRCSGKYQDPNYVYIYTYAVENSKVLRQDSEPVIKIPKVLYKV
jgi:hypothetical protein